MKADHPHGQRLLHDEPDDAAIGRADQLEGRDRFLLVDRHGVDDETDDHGGHREQQGGEQADLAARAIDDGAREHGFLIFLGERREMLPARDVLRETLRVDAGQQPHHDGVYCVDRSGRAGRTRRFAPRGRGREVELQLLRVSQRDEYDRIAARCHEVPGQSHHSERVAPKLDLLSERKPRPPVRDGLIAAAQDRPACNHERRFARPRDLCTDDEQALGLTAMLRLDILIGDAAGRRDTPLRGHGLARVAGKPRGLGEGAARVSFHDPDLRARRAHEPERFQNQAAIDADHGEHDAKQEAEPKACQQEATEIVADVFEREVHVTIRCERARRGPRVDQSGRRRRPGPANRT